MQIGPASSCSSPHSGRRSALNVPRCLSVHERARGPQVPERGPSDMSRGWEAGPAPRARVPIP
eukprot:scaffold54828_cov30-Tisochrysis_lutea.AAC.17